MAPRKKSTEGKKPNDNVATATMTYGPRATGQRPTQGMIIRTMGSAAPSGNATGRREGFTGKGGKKKKGTKAAQLERVKEAGQQAGKRRKVDDSGGMRSKLQVADNEEEEGYVKKQQYREHESYEKYFLAHHGNPPKTPDKLLDLSGEMQKLRQSAGSFEERFDNERRYNKDQVRQKRFGEWHNWLRSGHNIMVYGLGSKRDLLNEFGRGLKDGVVVAIDGFSDKAEPREVTSCLASGLLPGSSRASQSLTAVKRALGLRQLEDDAEEEAEGLGEGIGGMSSDVRGRRARLYLVVHNLERCSPGIQSLLLELIDAPRFHLVASMDHVNAEFGEVFSLRNVVRFHFTWHHVTTYDPYTQEAPLDATGIFDTGGSAQAGVGKVLEALTPNNREVFKILVERQLASADNSGLAYHEYYQACRQKFVVTSDSAFRNHLVEFEDHELIKRRKTSGGVELLFVPWEKGALQQLLIDMQRV